MSHAPSRARSALPWVLVAIAVLVAAGAVLVAIDRQGRIDDLESRERAAVAARPADADGVLARVSARAATAGQNARNAIRAARLQQGRIESLNRELAAGRTAAAIAAGRRAAACQVAAVRASTAASSVANALEGLAGSTIPGDGATRAGADVRLTAADGAFGQAQRSWVNAAAAVDVCAG